MSSLIKTLLIALVAVFAPAESMILSSMALIGVDLITGVMAAKKRNEPITSAGLKRTLVKIAVYEVALLLAFLAEQYLTMGFIPLARITASFIAVVELKSCYENLNDISGEDLLKTLLTKLNGPNE